MFFDGLEDNALQSFYQQRYLGSLGSWYLGICIPKIVLQVFT